MTSLSSRNILSHADQENAHGKNVAATKKRNAAPVTRSALGVVTNKQIGNIAAVGKPEVRKPVTRQKTTKSVKAVTEHNAVARLQNKLKNAEPMEMGTPAKEVEQKNVFDVTHKLDIEDIDRDDCENPQLCSEFVNHIYQYMLFLEAEYPIKKQYLKGTSLKPRMRSILVDWLIQVHHKFGLLQETLYLTIALLDRFLQVEPVGRTKLQLVGVTAMLLASKYEEMYAPEVNDFVYITDQAFTRSQILQMESVMLKKLGFNFGRPLPLHFLRRNSKAGQVDANQHALAKYLIELSLVDYEMCHVPPSKIAAAALCLSTKLLDSNDWTPTLEHYSRYSYAELKPVVCHLAKNLKATDTNTYLHAVRQKYSSHKAFKVSQIDEVKSPLVSELAEVAVSTTL